MAARTDRLEHKLDGELAQINGKMDKMSEMNCKFEHLDSKRNVLLDR